MDWEAVACVGDTSQGPDGPDRLRMISFHQSLQCDQRPNLLAVLVDPEFLVEMVVRIETRETLPGPRGTG